jgi:hypothetical protein
VPALLFCCSSALLFNNICSIALLLCRDCCTVFQAVVISYAIQVGSSGDDDFEQLFSKLLKDNKSFPWPLVKSERGGGTKGKGRADTGDLVVPREGDGIDESVMAGQGGADNDGEGGSEEQAEAARKGKERRKGKEKGTGTQHGTKRQVAKRGIAGITLYGGGAAAHDITDRNLDRGGRIDKNGTSNSESDWEASSSAGEESESTDASSSDSGRQQLQDNRDGRGKDWKKRVDSKKNQVLGAAEPPTRLDRSTSGGSARPNGNLDRSSSSGYFAPTQDRGAAALRPGLNRSTSGGSARPNGNLKAQSQDSQRKAGAKANAVALDRSLSKSQDDSRLESFDKVFAKAGRR